MQIVNLIKFIDYQYPIDLLLELSNDNYLMATQFSNKSVKIWSNNLTESFFINLNSTKTRISSMIQMNNLLLIGTCDSNIQIFDMTYLNETTTATKVIQTTTNNNNNNKGCVNALSLINFEQDTYLVTSTTSDTILQFWDSNLINIDNLTTQHTNTITNLAFNPNSSLLATSSNDFDQSMIIIWNVDSYQSNKTAFMKECSTCFVQTLTLLPNGNIVSGSIDGSLHVLNQNSLSLNQTLNNNNYAYVLSLITLKNEMFAVGYGLQSVGFYIEIYNSTSLELITTLNETGKVFALAMLQNGNLVSASSDEENGNYMIKIWNMITFIEIANWQAHSGSIFSLKILPNGNIISGSIDFTIKIWDSENLELMKILKVSNTVYSLLVLTDGNLATGISSTLSFWNMTTFETITNIDSHANSINTLSLLYHDDDDGDTILSGSKDKTIKLWKNYVLINTLNAIDSVYSILVLNDLNFLTGIKNNTIQQWKKNNNVSKINSLTTLKSLDRISTVSFLNANYLASGCQNGKIIIWDLLQFNLYKTLNGHLNAVTSLINLPNLKFASGSTDRTILIWDIQNSFQYNYNLTCHLGGINSLAYLNKQKLLVSSSKDVTSIIWNVNNDLILKYKLTNYNSSLSVQDVTELDDGTLLSCSDDLLITNWNYVSNSSFSFKTTHKDYVYSILKIINTSLIATGSKDLTIKLWNQSYLVSTLYGHLKPVISLLALPYYSDQAIPVLASGSCDTTIKTWNLTSYSLIHTLNAHTGCVNSLALYGSKIMLSGSSDMKIIVWNIINNFEIITYLTGHSNAINSIDTYENRLIASGSQDNTIKIWSIAYNNVKTLINHTDIVYGLATLKNGNLVSASQDNTIKIWDKNTFELLYTLAGHEGNVYTLTVLNNGLLVSGSFDKTIKVWNNTDLIKTITDHTSEVLGLAVLENGNFVSCSSDYTIRIWDTNTFDNLNWKVYNYGVSIYCLTGLQNDSGIAYGDYMGSIYILDSNSLDITHSIANAHRNVIFTLTFLQYNGNLVSGSADKLIKIWNKITFNLVITLVGHDSFINSIVSMNPNLLLSTSNDNTIKIWNTDTGNLIETCKGHSDIVNNVVVLDNDISSFASSSNDYTIKIWNKSDFQNIANLTGHLGSVDSVKFLNYGLMASGSLDKSIKLWETITFKNIATKYNAHSRGINSLKTILKSNKNYLISSSSDKTIKIWDTDLYLNISKLF